MDGVPPPDRRPRWLTAMDQLAVVLATVGLVGLFTGTRAALSVVALCAATAILGVHLVVTSRTAAHRVALRELRRDLDQHDGQG